MGGRGPAPGTNRKPAAQRRRRNQPAPNGTAAKATPGARAAAPALPRSYLWRRWDQELGEHREEKVTYLAATRAWYEAWKRSPIAGELELVHWLALRRAAKLVDRFERGDTSLADAIRKIETNFGGSPYDLRRLGHCAPPAADAGEQPQPQPGGGKVVDLRERLSAKR